MKLFIGDFSPNGVTLKEEEEHHIIKVLRMNSGEVIHVTDGEGNLVKARLMIRGKKAEIEIIETFPKKINKEKYLHIAIAPTKNIDRFEFFVEKAVELGVSEITPIVCTNSERKVLKTDKLQKQIESACKQSLQIIFPKLNPLIPLKSFAEKSVNNIIHVAHCYQEYNKISLPKIISTQKELLVLIGPEGDFSKKEIEHLYQQNSVGLDLGTNRLRTETAGIFVASSFYFSELE